MPMTAGWGKPPEGPVQRGSMYRPPPSTGTPDQVVTPKVPSLKEFGGSYMASAMPGISAVTPQFYGQMAQLLGRGGALDPQVLNDQLASIGHMTGAAGQDYMDRLAQLGMHRAMGGQAQLNAINMAGANMAQRTMTNEQQASIERLMKLLSLLGMYSTEPGMGGVTTAESARQFDETLKAQEGQRWIQALAAAGGVAANVMGP